LIFFDVQEALTSDIIVNLDIAQEKQKGVVSDAETTSRAETLWEERTEAFHGGRFVRTCMIFYWGLF